MNTPCNLWPDGTWSPTYRDRKYYENDTEYEIDEHMLVTPDTTFKQIIDFIGEANTEIFFKEMFIDFIEDETHKR